MISRITKAVPRGGPLGQNALQHAAGNVGQAESAAVVEIGKLLMIHPHQMEDGGVNIVYRDRILHCLVTDFIGAPIADTAANAATSHPSEESVRVMIPPVTGFRHNVECQTMPHRVLPVLPLLRPASPCFGIIRLSMRQPDRARLLTSVNAGRLFATFARSDLVGLPEFSVLPFKGLDQLDSVIQLV